MRRIPLWFDRLRIERFVWTLDSLLWDLPRRSRIEKRREIRQNLLAAADRVGTTEALRQLGGSSQLAREYVSAEFGDRPRHSWMAAGVFALTTTLVSTSLWNEAAIAFGAGITAGDPNASGTYSWHGITYLQNTVTFTLDHGHGSYSGGSFTVLFWVLLVIATVLVGRLWRLATRWSGRIRPAISTR